MSKITKLQFQKLQNRVNVFIDGIFFCGFATESVLKAGLCTGKELDDSQIENLISDSIKTYLSQEAMSFLGLRPRSKTELNIYLTKRFSKHIEKNNNPKIDFFSKKIIKEKHNLINQIIKNLSKNNYLNDEDFAFWWIEQRKRLNPKGKIALSIELQQKGVSKNVIESAFLKTSLNSKTETDSTIILILEKVWKTITARKYDKRKARELLIRRLLSRGFSYDQIKEKIDEFLSAKYNVDCS